MLDIPSVDSVLQKMYIVCFLKSVKLQEENLFSSFYVCIDHLPTFFYLHLYNIL